MSDSLTFLGSTVTLVVSIVFVIAIALLAVMAWRRSGFRLATGLLEGLRLLIAVGVAVTVNQPEWRVEFEPEARPTLAVLHDDSKSMETRDVLDPDQAQDPARTRLEWGAPLLEREFWNPVLERLDVVIEPLSSSSGGSSEITDLSTALAETLDRHADLRGVVLLSDGDWNAGESPVGAATRYRIRGVPVFTIAIGSETRLPDLRIEAVDAPSFGVVGKKLTLPFVIESTLPRPVESTLTLTSSFGEEVTHAVTIPAQGRLEDTLVWTPTRTGDGEITLTLPEHASESLLDNNVRRVPIDIREEALSVLLVESFPRWEYRYLRNALFRDPGVNVSCLLFHPGLPKSGGGPGYLAAFPATLEELSRYDVVFLGDVGVLEGQLTAEQCRLIKGLVQNQAAGLVLLPGRRGFQQTLVGTELEEISPVVIDPLQPRGWGGRLPMAFELTEAGRRSLLTQLVDGEARNAELWRTLPGFHWYAPVQRAKAGTQVLAVHATESNRWGRLPLIVSRTSQTGKILFMGTDSAWRWREGIEDRYHYRFWGQVVRWMAYQRHMARGEKIRLFYSPDRPEVDHVVSLNANASGTGGEPLQDGEVMVQAVAPSGRTETIRLAARNEEWGLFTGSFLPDEAGEYVLHVSHSESGSIEVRLAVEGVDPERPGQPARPDVLAEIAAITRGRTFETFDVAPLLGLIQALPEPEPEVRRLRLWCHPTWVGILVLLLGIFWFGRKLVGSI